jgi:hypothetical protein
MGLGRIDGVTIVNVGAEFGLDDALWRFMFHEWSATESRSAPPGPA